MRRKVTVLTCAGIVAVCFWSGLAMILAAGPPPSLDAPRPAPQQPVADGPVAAAEQPARREVLSDAAVASDQPAARRLDFDTTVDQLVALGVSMWRALQLQDREKVDARNTEAEALLVELMVARKDAGELALDRVTRVPVGEASIEVEIRRHVLERILRDALALRHAATQDSPERGPLDVLVDAMLATLPLDQKLARGLGTGLLADQPYLGPGQERAVLELAEMVPEMPFLEPVVADLLRTLWTNLEASGARSSGRLASLAMLFLEDANPARRTAAVQRLLKDARYRDFAIAHVVRNRDLALAKELAEIAATELPPSDALSVLKAVEDVGGEELIAAYLVLGTRDGALLGREYEQVLADGVRPRLRASLITGATADIDAGSTEIARVAFEHDPDPEVRLRALYALAMSPDAGIAEAALSAALDDPNAARDPGWVGSVALALRNLATTGAVQALDRLGRRLEQHPLLSELDRRELRALLAEHLPNRR